MTGDGGELSAQIPGPDDGPDGAGDSVVAEDLFDHDPRCVTRPCF